MNGKKVLPLQKLMEMKMRFTLVAACLFIGLGLMSQEVDSTYRMEVAPPTILLPAGESDDDDRSQDISDLLQSSQDVFMNIAGYTFGQARYRIRGYDNRNMTVLMNGIRMNDAETGRPYYSDWGGLNDVVRNKVINTGLSLSDYDFGGLGGTTNIITRASQYRPNTSVSYAFANRNYRHRVMLTHSTGLLDNGWAFTASLSTRWAVRGYVPGTFYQAFGYFAAAEKVFNKKHSLNLTIFGAPNRAGKSGVATLEAYELTGDHYYNPNWGYQNGEVRNARVNNYHQPRAILSHYWNINDNLKLTTAVSYKFGRGGSTALNWYDAADPRPDYYRNLPSYYAPDDARHQQLANLWQQNANYGQLDFDAFYAANRKNLYSVVDESGSGETVTGNRAKYIIEERRNDANRLDLSSTLDILYGKNGKAVVGINAMMNRTHYFKTVDDLLGADWWLDIDQFAERDFHDNTMIQSDIDVPNRTVKKGDKFGYDYFANVGSGDVFALTEYKFSHINIYGGLKFTYTDFWRSSKMRNGKFPDNSGGESAHNRFFDYAAKVGTDIKITGRNFIIVDAAYMTRAPYFRDAFISPRTRDNVIDGLTGEKIFSTDASYVFRSPFVHVKLTGYYTRFDDGIQSSSFYHDELRTFVNFVMTDVDKLHYGGEIGLETQIASMITITAAAGYGQFIYNSRPCVTIVQDNSSKPLENRQVYIKNYHIGRMPELATSIGVKVNAPKRWFFGLDANYYAENYVTINPDKHTQEALNIFVSGDPQIDEILHQEKLEHGFVMNFFGGKSWRIKHKYNIGFSLNINNLLNNKNFITSGFEQYRFKQTDIDKFPNKYYYMYGISYFLNVYFRF